MNKRNVDEDLETADFDLYRPSGGRTKSFRRFLLGFSAIALLPVVPAAAQSETKLAANAATSRVEQIETVTVTATKRVERLVDVPASITALSTEDLKATDLVRLQDYMARVPSLVINDTAGGGGMNQVFMRGITTGMGGNPTVGFYIDDTPFGSSTSLGMGEVFAPDIDPSDISQIEVLRGPQGTLYGAGSMGGLIKYDTAVPNFDGFSGRLELSGSAVDGGGTGYGVRGAANIPLTDEIAVRVSGFDREDPGYIDNVTTGKKNVNSMQTYGGHASVLYKPTESFSVRFSALVQDQSMDGAALIDVDATTKQPLAGRLGQVSAYNTGIIDASYGLYSVQVADDFGWATLQSTSSYGRLTVNGRTDITQQMAPYFAMIFGFDDNATAIHDTSALSKATQEFRLYSPTDQTLSWQFGVFYTNESNKIHETMAAYEPATGAALGVDLPLLEDYYAPNRYEEVAVYGDVTYKITDKFDVTGGLRFSHNSQQAHETFDGLFAGTGNLHLKSDDGALTFLFSPRYHIDENTMAYIRIASGYRPGGPNIVVAGVSPSYDSDRVVNYEIGLKGDALDGKLSYDMAAFYIDWSHIQLRQVSDIGTQYFGNAGKASSKGVEASVVWSPIDGLDLSGNLAYTEASLGKELTPPLIGSKGDTLPYTPRFGGRIGADYHFPIWNEWTGLAGIGYRYTGKRFTDFQMDASIPRYRMGDYGVFDMNVGVQNDVWTATLYAKNLGDSHGQTSTNIMGAVQQVTVIQPRTFGFTLSRKF